MSLKPQHIVLLCLLLSSSCVVKKTLEQRMETAVTTVVEAVIVREIFLINIARESAFDIYRNDSIGVNTSLYVHQFDATFSGATDTFSVRVNSYEVKKVAGDSLVFRNFLPDSLWRVLPLDSANVKVTCIYEVTGLEMHPLPNCITNSYLIRADGITNNLDYKSCY